MKFIRDLISRKPEDPAPVAPLRKSSQSEELLVKGAAAPAPKPRPKRPVVDAAPAAKVVEFAKQETPAVDPDASVVLEKVNAKVKETAPVSIWDMDGEEAEAPAEPAAKPRRRRNNKTRVLGFNPDAEDNVVSAFDAAAPVSNAVRAKFPVGWVLVVDGPGRGECFTLEAGMSQIGRGDDQAISLDFGDASISRMNHAAIVYDPDTHDYMLGHGGKKNIVRLNGKPVISNETMSSGDEIKIGETTLRFVGLCTEEFNWAEKDAQDEDGSDVAIA